MRRIGGAALLALLAGLLLVVQFCGRPEQHDPRWQVVGEWSGDAYVQTEPFEIASGVWRVHWRAEVAEETNYFAAWVHTTDGRSSEMVVSRANRPSDSGSAPLRSGPGQYYLEISPSAVRWSLTVEHRP